MAGSDETRMGTLCRWRRRPIELVEAVAGVWAVAPVMASALALALLHVAGGLPAERNGRAKLTWSQVREMRALWARGTYSYAALAWRYGSAGPRSTRSVRAN